MTSEPLIVSNPAVMFGKPVIRGTRITVELILEHLAAGRSPQELMEFYPHLTLPSILAAARTAKAGKSA